MRAPGGIDAAISPEPVVGASAEFWSGGSTIRAHTCAFTDVFDGDRSEPGCGTLAFAARAPAGAGAGIDCDAARACLAAIAFAAADGGGPAFGRALAGFAAVGADAAAAVAADAGGGIGCAGAYAMVRNLAGFTPRWFASGKSFGSAAGAFIGSAASTIGESTNLRRAAGSRIVTVPSGVTAQLAPLGSPPSSPSSLRAPRSAPIQLGASISSWCNGVLPLSGLTTSFHFLPATWETLKVRGGAPTNNSRQREVGLLATLSTFVSTRSLSGQGKESVTS